MSHFSASDFLLIQLKFIYLCLVVTTASTFSCHHCWQVQLSPLLVGLVVTTASRFSCHHCWQVWLSPLLVRLVVTTAGRFSCHHCQKGLPFIEIHVTKLNSKALNIFVFCLYFFKKRSRVNADQLIESSMPFLSCFCCRRYLLKNCVVSFRRTFVLTPQTQ